MSERVVRVLVVDDSAYNRRTIIRMLEEIPGIQVLGYACNGEEGLRKVFDLKPDLITLDLEMPRMDGFSFLRILMQNRPTPVIVISSRSGDEDVFKALDFGAVEFVSKPSAQISPELFNIRDDLLRKVREVAGTDMRKVLQRSKARHKDAGLPARTSPRVFPSGLTQVVIGASTGGPPALQTLFTAIRSRVEIGFAVSQHMPPGFTRAFADRLNKIGSLEIKEAENGDLMKPGRVLVAPGGRNLTFRRRGGDVIAQVGEPSPDQRYTPSVDAMFQSSSEIFGDQLLAVVLTGMGNDGARGVRLVKQRGGQVLAEAEESSVVFGMPKEAIATGMVDRVVPLAELSREILIRCGY
ncbi:chemotaxis-specific protein-glutamate methyltransferase CheB [Geothermobacter hydrogeniphilus]|uniref:Protein-glutamate methylesterase/protein-glutamine glutaminase n=1 Tax=Geothermobacter hydrogeniphilus TaxID=1969733 RepID=A0A1X0YDR2_9BACT|nr:chemotaxis-specific protein-glutamate methyltransferase CheB [Geothermobacter hydrogeniphilus]ORJ63345.1 chemotaxis response regulator protein-glutamate methylesterase [Geothermobacter hydrogeniphilus]